MLDSWNDGATKSAILEFVRAVTTPGDPFVPPVERIATFDNDGTLWCEKPHYTQAEFLMRRRTQEAGPDDGRGRAHRPARNRATAPARGLGSCSSECRISSPVSPTWSKA